MANIQGLQKLLTDLAKDVSRAYKMRGVDSFNAYYDLIQDKASPYVHNGFLDKNKAPKRFISETAMLHMATTLFEEWCLIHEIGEAKNYFSVHREGAYFSWYKISRNLKKQIDEWVVANPEIQDAPQIISLLAENTLAGLSRRSLGEFYTPTKISEHLYSLTKFKARNITMQKAVDPACGSGNLLKILVSDVAKLVKEEKLSAKIALKALNENVYGYDIQPVAILITKLQLLLVSLPILEKLNTTSANLYELLPFENIKLTDPLSNARDYWDAFAKFDLVIGNPPYLKVIKENLPFHKEFQEIFSGQPNLYQMFLWWAVKATRADGSITFLIPQSIRSGQYFSKLRKEISKFCEIKSITCFIAQEGVFESVQQQMMIVSLSKKRNLQKPSVVTIRKSFNGDGLANFKEIRLNQNRVVFQNDGEAIWCISDSEIDYQILNRAYKQTSLLKDFEQVEILNGGFVWNQNKPSLRSKGVSESNVVPLISAGSVGVHEFIFPPKDERLENRIFVERKYGVTQSGYSTRSILIKRTTPKKLQGRRIIACELPRKFLENYPVYFCENHVNLILQKGSENYLGGLTSWLNSRLANFLFGMMNGSSHLSKYELGLLPISLELLQLLGESKLADKNKLLLKSDEIIYSFYKLNTTQIKRINQLISLPN
ncbi:N-6 DNA methylase [Candidatus Micrarchaeota archaeon]|nr:N-6 DNA methylase [Candidatus Micrarchaeota archaeon]